VQESSRRPTSVVTDAIGRSCCHMGKSCRVLEEDVYRLAIFSCSYLSVDDCTPFAVALAISLDSVLVFETNFYWNLKAKELPLKPKLPQHS